MHLSPVTKPMMIPGIPLVHLLCVQIVLNSFSQNSEKDVYQIRAVVYAMLPFY